MHNREILLSNMPTFFTSSTFNIGLMKVLSCTLIIITIIIIIIIIIIIEYNK